MKQNRSKQLFSRAQEVIPGGVNSPVRAFKAVGGVPLFIKEAKGAYMIDADNNRYIDLINSWGPMILGHANPIIEESVISALKHSISFGAPTEAEVEMAALICSMVPSIEKVRMVNSGTEAVMAALRLARAFTGKDGHAVIEGGYHGVFSEVMWYSEVEGWAPADGTPEVLPFGDGVPAVTKRLFHPLPLNDANAVEDLFRKKHEQIGSFLIEPIMGNCCAITASAQYMKDVRTLCDRYDILLIIDEVKTGFRVAKGGVQELFGIKADLCTFAKALANGYPISVVAGREDIMRQAGNGVVHGGTFTAHSVSLAAADRTLQILDETSALRDIESYGLKLQAGLSKILGERGIPHCFTGHPALMGLFFAEKPPTDYRGWINSDYEFYDSLAPELHELGILIEPDSREPWFLCEAHNVKCLDETLDKFEQAVDITINKNAKEKRPAANA